MLKALFLDRDGVINDNKKHVNQPQDLIIYQEAKEALSLAYQSGFILFVVTNQGGIERGYFKPEDLERIHQRLKQELFPYCKIEEIVYCPDFNKDSPCRKPNPGMIVDLLNRYPIDSRESWMIGDRNTDILAGKMAGCKTAKIGAAFKEADIQGENLLEVVRQILSC
ncbi:HAD family hydrolase [Irregularibacter muris]|uniref:D,D-heptose 1,7-bisphosphate phosphatase n=1 Tax=Irregularibacter muris TaxID=1796619 RepID=A0AAE3HEC6_9FIRM|nr:HAD family hydrolase [Irregularibacter muris]MCR1897935.1 HAD family hydrolase [Irregularibacter muris]